MKRKCLECFAFAVLFATGCGSSVSTNPADYVGEYIFTPTFSDPGDFASFVILKQDHTAVEIRFSKASGQVQTTTEKWELDLSAKDHYTSLGIGKFSHSIERSGSTIKLGINSDLNLYYEKVR
jgi:hypothetical protein